MARNTFARRRGGLEQLESRQLLAGDVLVNVVGGNLRIEGDAQANQIMITSGAETGTFVVTGLDGTLVRGGTEAVTVTGVRNIRVNLGDGADLVALVGADVRGNVDIRTGDGADRVLVGTGEGAPELTGVLPADVSVNVRGIVDIETGAGTDQISVDSTTAALLSIDAGADNDVVSLGSDAAAVDASARVNVRHALHVSLGAGDDQLNLDQVSTRGAVLLRGSLGDDTITANATSATAFGVLGDGGVDRVTLTNLDVRHLGVHTGDGNDTVEIRDSAFASLGVSLGAGDDTLTTAALESRVAVLAGGDGEDTLTEASASVFTQKRIQGFEIPPDVNVNELSNRGNFFRGFLRRAR